MRDKSALTLCPLGFLELPPPELISLAARAGFDAVSVRTRAAIPGGPEHPMRLGDPLFEQTRRTIQATGVDIESVEQVGLKRDLDVASLEPMLEAASALGATRVLCSGDEVDQAIVVERFASLCDLAAKYGMAVDLEFMRFREVKTIEDASAVVTLAGRRNGFVMIDALHLFRSGGTLEKVRGVPAGLISGIQLCDAPLEAPPIDGIAEEARHRRLPLGEGGLPLAELLDCLSSEALLSVEIPLPGERATWSADARAQLLGASTRSYLLQSH